MEQKKQMIEIRKLEQFLSNIKVLNELKQPNPRLEVLKSYSGFGGLQQCFNSKQLYGTMMRELRSTFGREQEHQVFESIRHSCTSGYYTPKEIIGFMYKYLYEVCNFAGGDILEPSCGSGSFFEYMPKNIMMKSKITGIEMDIFTSKLVQRIYDHITVINKPLQEVDFTDKKYDLIIGNPPYGYEVIMDKAMPDISNYTIHHYFVAKCVRLLKDNGILALVLPSFYADIPCSNTRHIVSNEAVLIDMVRLPDNLFAQANITVDVVFIRKTGNKIHSFTNTVILEQDGKKDSINEYWKNKPHRILGELKLKWVEVYKRYVPTCTTPDIKRVYDSLTNCRFSSATKNNYHLIAG